MNRKNAPYKDVQLTFAVAGTDRSMYAPGEDITLRCALSVTSYPGSSLCLETSLLHNEETVTTLVTELLADAKDPTVVLTAPETDFTGYLIKMVLKDDRGNVLASDTSAADVSSTWVKFPRYGYLCDYEASIDADDLIEKMNVYHLNAIEYYDWHHLHHEPLPDSVTADNLHDWTDWAGRTISVSTLTDYISAAREKNMVSMAYNMIYAGTDTCFVDADGNPTHAADWQIYFKEGNPKGKGPFVFTMGDSPSGDGHLYFVNTLNPEWQEYIFAKENRALDVLGFDGWHGDTVGEYGELTDVNGDPLGYDENGTPIYLVKDTYRTFLNNAKAALGDKYLSFNPVGAQGNEQCNTSNTDVLYAEFWPWEIARDGEPFNTYHSILREVERSTEDSKPYSIDGKGKSLVVKAYINPETRKEFMNDHAVRLMDAVAYAAGGDRLELGNGNHMLHTAYYPDDKIPMSDALMSAMADMADFTVAYENLLRDGQHTIDARVEIADVATSNDGDSYKVWTYTREDDRYRILHLINLKGNNNQWVDEKGRKKEPEFLENLEVKFYTDREITEVYLASPDYNGCESVSLGFAVNSDEHGSYISFTIPSLMYWDMIYMK